MGHKSQPSMLPDRTCQMAVRIHRIFLLYICSGEEEKHCVSCLYLSIWKWFQMLSEKMDPYELYLGDLAPVIRMLGSCVVTLCCCGAAAGMEARLNAAGVLEETLGVHSRKE